MKQEFEIEIKEILFRVQKVEAELVGEAIDKAMKMYYRQEIILDAEGMKDVDFSQMKQEKGKSVRWKIIRK